MCKIGKVYVIGLGPGAEKEMTYQASTALEKSEVIIGYTVYTGLIRERFPDKKYLSTPMRQEVIRCEMAMDEAMKGSTVAMVCSGDAGIYGMAGLLYEMGQGYPEVELEVVPGITAANGGAAVLGAPLMHDFAVISLSDLLTPWEKIEKRIRGLIVILIITEKMIISGVLIAARISIWYAFCTFVTSVVILVTSEEDENLSISANAKS